MLPSLTHRRLNVTFFMVADTGRPFELRVQSTERPRTPKFRRNSCSIDCSHKDPPVETRLLAGDATVYKHSERLVRYLNVLNASIVFGQQFAIAQETFT